MCFLQEISTDGGGNTPLFFTEVYWEVRIGTEITGSVLYRTISAKPILTAKNPSCRKLNRHGKLVFPMTSLAWHVVSACRRPDRLTADVPPLWGGKRSAA